MGGKNSFFKKPFGTGSGSAAQMFGMEKPDIKTGALSAEDAALQSELGKTLSGDIAGTGPSLAVEQYKAAQDDALKQAQALASSTRDNVNPALLARNISNTAGMQQQELAKNSAILRMQERQNAINAMNQFLATKMGAAQQSAAMQNQANQSVADRQSQILGSAGSAIAAFSDKDLKKNINKSNGDANKKIEDFLSAIDSYNFEYKDDELGKGERTGVMAQDLEKTDLGKQMVMDTPGGKVVDFGQGFAAILAAQAELKSDLDKLKKKKA